MVDQREPKRRRGDVPAHEQNPENIVSTILGHNADLFFTHELAGALALVSKSCRGAALSAAGARWRAIGWDNDDRLPPGILPSMDLFAKVAVARVLEGLVVGCPCDCARTIGRLRAFGAFVVTRPTFAGCLRIPSIDLCIWSSGMQRPPDRWELIRDYGFDDNNRRPPIFIWDHVLEALLFSPWIVSDAGDSAYGECFHPGNTNLTEEDWAEIMMIRRQNGGCMTEEEKASWLNKDDGNLIYLTKSTNVRTGNVMKCWLLEGGLVGAYLHHDQEMGKDAPGPGRRCIEFNYEGAEGRFFTSDLENPPIGAESVCALHGDDVCMRRFFMTHFLGGMWLKRSLNDFHIGEEHLYSYLPGRHLRWNTRLQELRDCNKVSRRRPQYGLDGGITISSDFTPTFYELRHPCPVGAHVLRWTWACTFSSKPVDDLLPYGA